MLISSMTLWLFTCDLQCNPFLPRNCKFFPIQVTFRQSVDLFNAVFNIILGIMHWAEHLSMLSLSFFTSTPYNVLSHWLIFNLTIVWTKNSAEREINPVVVTIINPWKQYLPSHGWLSYMGSLRQSNSWLEKKKFCTTQNRPLMTLRWKPFESFFGQGKNAGTLPLHTSYNVFHPSNNIVQFF